MNFANQTVWLKLSRAHESQLLPLKRRSLDVHIEKIEEGHRLKRQQIKSWTGCSKSNEQLGPRHYLQKMILLSGAWLCTLRLREMNLKEEEEREVWHLNLDIMEGITMHQLASWPGLEVLNYLKDQVRDYLIHQEADSLVGKVLWLELHINLELHTVIQEWARLQAQVVELMVVELQHILGYHMVIPQVQVDLPGQDQILPQAFMVDNLMGRLLALDDYVAEEKIVGAFLIWTMMSSGEGCDDGPLPTKLADRIRTSKSWAAWAPGLVAAIKESLRRLLGVLEEESRSGDTHNMSKMDLAAWHRHIKQGHIPFRADCRICGEAMGCDKPHKRLGGSATKFTMSADLCGPFPAGRDLGTGVTCKYALISTVAVPIVSELPGEVAEPYDTADDVKHTEDLPCDPEEREMLSDDEVQRLNELAQIEEAQEAPGHQNITFAEVIPDRTVESLVRALSRLHAKYRMLGIQVYRLHTDRERSFASAIMDLQEVPSIKHRIVGKHPPPLPDHPLAGAVGALYDKSDPALAACRAGGEDPLPFLDEFGCSLALQCEDEGESEEVVGGSTPKTHDQGDQCQHPDLPGELEDPMCCSRQQAEQWHELEQQRHLALKQLWCQGLREVAVGEDAGSVHGSWLREVELLLRGAEDQLSFQHSSLQNYKMASLAPMAGSTEVPVTVLQTYTVSLQQVRKELEKWKPPLRDEYGQLVSSTQAIKPTTEEKLVLVEAGICPPTELWEISHAVYGLNDAPANWSHYRDRELPQLRFKAEGHEYQLVTTPEPNLWKLVKVWPNSIPEDDTSEGFLAVYVDDMLVAAPSPLAQAVIDGIRARWRCSEPEWASSEKSLKFCGFEIKCRPGEVILNQTSYTRDLLARHEGPATVHVPDSVLGSARMAARPMVPTEEQWVGYSFFRDNPPQPPLPEHATLDSQTSSSTPAGQTTGSSSTPTPPGQSLSTSQVSASSGPPPVRPEDELLRGIRRVRRGSTDSSTGTPTSTLSSTMTASTRGMDAMEAPLTLGYLGRMRGQENRGERPAPPNMQVPLEEERSDWILSLHSEGLLLARHPNLPDEATPQWLGIQMPVARSSRPAGAGRPSEASRPAARSEGNRPAARSSLGPMPINEEWDSDGSYELLTN
ncbi:unnamed protein product [Durusdinium trenchii]|uniref:Reverse transcriptase Ty1/copia-type domain-containing protein n=1 Tax=Durusdinium trenchii TaxID=1381693 RepID=A0ABP0H8R1_9DINO